MKTKTQKIKRTDLAKIYPQVCNDWQKRIAETLIKQINSSMIEVSNDDVLQAYKEADSSKKELILKYFEIKEDITPIEKIKTFDDILRISGKKLKDILPYPKPKNKAQVSQNALAKIQLITEVYNEDTILDWNDHNQYKYIPWFKKVGSCWVVYDYFGFGFSADAGFGSYYKSSKLALDASKKFIDIYKDFLP